MTRAQVFVATALLAVALGVFVFRISRDMRDFEVPYTVAVRAAAATPLYRAEDEHYQFKYLPAFAVLAIPLGLLPLSVAKGVWFVASVGMMIALITLSIRLLPEQRTSTTFLVVSAIVVLAKFYGRELDLGQVNLAFAVAAAGAFVAMKEGHDVLAALLLVLTIAIKPYGALLLPVLLVRPSLHPRPARRLGEAGPAAALDRGDRPVGDAACTADDARAPAVDGRGPLARARQGPPDLRHAQPGLDDAAGEAREA